MKKKLLRFLSCLMTVILTVLLLIPTMDLTARKASVIKYHDFFRQEADFNVLFFGSSHMINGVYPVQLWEEHGIVSYNFGGHANRITTSYWVMENALDYTTPKLVVIDCLGLSVESRTHNQYQYLHQSLDAFPLTATKTRAVFDLIREDEVENPGQLRFDLLMPFSSYHNRWTELSKEDFLPRYNVQKGAEARVGVQPATQYAAVSTGQVIPEKTINWEYLERMIATCKEQNIEVLLTYLPFPPDENSVIEAQTVPQIAEKYGVNYINFLELGVIDYYTDVFDESHLNPSGAYKVTHYLGDYITENYSIPDQRSNPAYANWEKASAENTKYMKERFWYNTDCAEDNLCMMVFKAFDYMLMVDGRVIKDQPVVSQQLQNLGVSMEEISDGRYFVLLDNETGQIAYIPEADLIKTQQDTSLGKLSLQQAEDNTKLVKDGTICYEVASSTWNAINLQIFCLEGNELFHWVGYRLENG